MHIFIFLAFLNVGTFLFSASETMLINEELNQKEQRKKAWTAAEDELLLSTIELCGAKNWRKIAQHIAGRSGKQCSERYKNHLDPTVKKDAFTEEEEALLSAKIAEYQQGTIPWATIAEDFFTTRDSTGIIIERRTDLRLKNFWNSAKKMRAKKARMLEPPATKKRNFDSFQETNQSCIISVNAPNIPAFSEAISQEAKARSLKIRRNNNEELKPTKEIPTIVSLQTENLTVSDDEMQALLRETDGYFDECIASIAWEDSGQTGRLSADLFRDSLNY